MTVAKKFGDLGSRDKVEVKVRSRKKWALKSLSKSKVGQAIWLTLPRPLCILTTTKRVEQSTGATRTRRPQAGAGEGF